jgi:hypothetical protein
MNTPEALKEVSGAVKEYLTTQGWPNLTPDAIIGAHLPGIWKHLTAKGLVDKYGLSYKAMVDHAMNQRMMCQQADMEEALRRHFGI